MSEKVDIWMPLYVKDYLAGTSRLTTEQHGAYLLLIMDYWLNGALPDDDALLAQICKLSTEQWSKHRPIIERLFLVHSGEWRHKRIDREADTAKDRRKAAQDRGKKGARARWGDKNKPSNGTSIDHAMPEQWMADGPAPAPAPTEVRPKNNRSSADASDRFKDFWSAYPKKVKKAESQKVWKSKRLNGKADEIIADVNLRKRSDRRWLDGFRPDPTTYLRGERWNDEIEGGQQRQDDPGEWGLE